MCLVLRTGWASLCIAHCYVAKTNVCGRSDSPAQNFGFSGSGHMDLGIGMWLETIEAAAFIIGTVFSL